MMECIIADMGQSYTKITVLMRILTRFAYLTLHSMSVIFYSMFTIIAANNRGGFAATI